MNPNYHLRGLSGIAELKQEIASLIRSFPDLCFEIEEMTAEGDAVVKPPSWLRCWLSQQSGIGMSSTNTNIG
jgi:predicted ester cyclase